MEAARRQVECIAARHRPIEQDRERAVVTPPGPRAEPRRHLALDHHGDADHLEIEEPPEERRRDGVRQVRHDPHRRPQRRHERAEIQFERGDVDNREVVDAEQSLLDARNSLISEQVRYEIARLRLLRNLGILFIGEGGMWQE